MQVELVVYGPFREVIGEKRVRRSVPADATVGHLLEAVADDYPSIAGHLVGGEDSTGRSVTVTVDGTPIRDLDGETTVLSPGATVALTSPVKGGAGSG